MPDKGQGRAPGGLSTEPAAGSAAAGVAGSLADAEASDVSQGASARMRLYGLCLTGAVLAFLVVHGFGRGAVFWTLGAAILLALAAGLVRGTGSRLAEFAALGAGALAVAVPLGTEVLGGTALPLAVARTAVWPQILVLLFAARLLGEVTEARFAAFWRHPFGGGGRPGTQSFAAALLLGACLALVFYQFVGGYAATTALDPVSITLRALAGPTFIHVAIIVLFFVLVAAVGDAYLLLLSDRAALGEVRRGVAGRLAQGTRVPAGEVAALVSAPIAHLAHTRAFQFLREAAAGGGRGRQAAAPSSELETLEGFHAASRRFARALLSFLPLLGFLGTVVGLAVAIGSLGTKAGSAGGDAAGSGGVDLAASLAGLSIQFETTLLGLLGGLLGSLLLSLLEKREAEFRSECARLVEIAVGRDVR